MQRCETPRPVLLGMGWFPDQVGGLNRYFRDLVVALGRLGADPNSVVVGPVNDPAFPGASASEIYRTLPTRIWRYNRVSGKAIRSAGVVDAHFALYAFAPVVVGKLRRLPLVVHFQGPWADESGSVGAGRAAVQIKRSLERVVYRRAREAIVLTFAFKRLLVERYGVAPWRVNVIPPGVDLDQFRPGSRSEARVALGVEGDRWVCLAVRRLVPRMGIDVLLEAWVDILRERDSSLLLIAGGGPAREELERKAEELGIRTSVQFLGHVDDERLVACYQAADVCVVPSTELEGFGLVVLESLACGTPVVATDVGGLPEALAELDETLVVPGGDAPSLARRIVAGCLGSRPFPGPDTCRRYAEKFSWDAVASRNAQVYAKAVKQPVPKRLRVVYLDHCAQLSGGELALARLLPALAGEVEAHVILAEHGPLVSMLHNSAISVEVIPMAEATRRLRRDRIGAGTLPLRTGVDIVLYVARLARRLRQLRPDLVETNSLKSALYGGVAAKLARVPVVWHIRDRISEDYLPPQAARLVRVLGRRLPDAVIANSKSTLECLCLGPPVPASSGQGLVRRQGVVIYSPVAKGLAMPSDGISANPALRIGIVGRIASWKGQDVFIMAFARAFSATDARAVIIGAPLFGEKDYELELKALVARLGLDRQVEFCGFVHDVGGALATLDILVHASVLPEPFGQVVVEGMAAGLPVVASSAGGPGEVIEDGVTGVLYPPGDVGALAERLVHLGCDPALRRRIGEAARTKASQFLPDALAPQVLQVYRGVLGRDRA